MKMNESEWENTLTNFESPSFLQSWDWGEQKEDYGWNKDFLVWRNDAGTVNAAAMVLSQERQIKPFGISIRILYIPHGPILDWQNRNLRKRVLGDLIDYTDQKQAVYLKIDPQIILRAGLLDKEKFKDFPANMEAIRDITASGFIKSTQEIQFRNTFHLDLRKSLDDLLAEMKQKTRYNIRLAIRKGVNVRKLSKDELQILFDMYLETSNRDGFIIRPKEYYLNLWSRFISSGMATPLIADVDGEPVAGLVLIHFHKKSYYFHGMSLEKHRDKMPNYLLQWDAIKISKELGCDIYDLWGAPEEIDPENSMWGVYRFKSGLGARLIQTFGAYDYASKKIEYTILQNMIPRIQKITRKFRRRQIKSEIGIA